MLQASSTAQARCREQEFTIQDSFEDANEEQIVTSSPERNVKSNVSESSLLNGDIPSKKKWTHSG